MQTNDPTVNVESHNETEWKITWPDGHVDLVKKGDKVPDSDFETMFPIGTRVMCPVDNKIGSVTKAHRECRAVLWDGEDGDSWSSARRLKAVGPPSVYE